MYQSHFLVIDSQWRASCIIKKLCCYTYERRMCMYSVTCSLHITMNDDNNSLLFLSLMLLSLFSFVLAQCNNMHCWSGPNMQPVFKCLDALEYIRNGIYNSFYAIIYNICSAYRLYRWVSEICHAIIKWQIFSWLCLLLHCYPAALMLQVRI